jgi:NADPH:quinone reductase-like Zn-dependent oxidoreductase
MQQKALIIPTKQAPFVVGPIDIPKPGPDQILIKVIAAALNPVDWKVHQRNVPPAPYPAVLGFDMSGVVEETGEGVSAFKKGDRV